MKNEERNISERDSRKEVGDLEHNEERVSVRDM